MVEQTHKLILHAGTTTMLSLLSNTYFNGLKRLVKYVIHSCVSCRRAAAKVAKQLMGELPSSRVVPARPFSTTGVDFAGPVFHIEGS